MFGEQTFENELHISDVFKRITHPTKETFFRQRSCETTSYAPFFCVYCKKDVTQYKEF